MATVFFAWELGAGLGHLLRVASLAKALAAEGHRVYLAARDLGRVESVFAGSKVHYLQAPCGNRSRGPTFRRPVTFAHILHNVGFGDDRELVALTGAWRNLYRFTKPDVIVCDHSPTAMLAARGGPARVALIGTGFCIPPDVYPFPVLRPGVQADPARLRADEDPILHRANQILRARRQPPMERLGQLYSQVSQSFLTTFAELDHYPHRPSTAYWGPVTGIDAGGKMPVWPNVPGKRIFGYLKGFPALPQLLEFLNVRGLPTLIYGDGIDAALSKRFGSSTLRLERERLDVQQVADHCDLAITNATFGTTAMMLMNGKPLLMLPLVLEQGIMARVVQKLGAGLGASARQPAMICDRLQQLLDSQGYSQQALRLAKRFSGFDASRQQQKMLDRVSELISSVP